MRVHHLRTVVPLNIVVVFPFSFQHRCIRFIHHFVVKLERELSSVVNNLQTRFESNELPNQEQDSWLLATLFSSKILFFRVRL
jgi:hypothetical protein